MQVHDSLSGLVGNTPLVRLRSVTRGIPGATVLAKVEYFNPGGSVKDRIALRMVAAAEASGDLKPGGTIVEPTSGNTGVGLAIVAAERGYRCVFVCPDKVAQDKISVLRAYGAEVVVCPGTVAPDHPDSYYSVARRMAAEMPGGWQPDQYANPENPASHHDTTGPEIWAQTDGTVTHFVAGIGTGWHHHRHRTVPERGLGRRGAGDRRRSGRLGLLGRIRSSVPGRGRRRGHLAGYLRPVGMR